MEACTYVVSLDCNERLRGQKVRRTLSVGLPADVTVKRKKCDGDPGGLVQGQVPEITVTLNHRQM